MVVFVLKLYSTCMYRNRRKWNLWQEPKNIPISHQRMQSVTATKKMDHLGNSVPFLYFSRYLLNAASWEEKFMILFFRENMWKEKEILWDENGNCCDDSITQNENECNLFHHSTPPQKCSIMNDDASHSCVDVWCQIFAVLLITTYRQFI